MDLADDAQVVEALEREAAIRRAVQGHRQEDQVFNGRGEVVCRDCDHVIPAARLAAVPKACRCVMCQADHDEEEG